MPRLAEDTTVVSQPVRTFPNGDIFFVELTRRHNRYNCLLKMAREGNAAKAVVVARAQGKTIREAEQDCDRAGIAVCLRREVHTIVPSSSLLPDSPNLPT